MTPPFPVILRGFRRFRRDDTAGNPLAVVQASEGLTDARMQAIAREFILSETVFTPLNNPAHYEAAVRIFTPG